MARIDSDTAVRSTVAWTFERPAVDWCRSFEPATLADRLAWTDRLVRDRFTS